MYPNCASTQLAHHILQILKFSSSIETLRNSPSIDLNPVCASLHHVVNSQVKLLPKLSSNIHSSIAVLVAGILQRIQLQKVKMKTLRLDLAAYGDLAVIVASVGGNATCLDGFLQDLNSLWHLLFDCVQLLTEYSPRDQLWHCALGDLLMHPFDPTHTKHDYHGAIKKFLCAAYLMTDFYQGKPGVSILQQIPENMLLRLMYCLTKVGGYVEAAVICQLFPKPEHNRGLHMLQQSPSEHNAIFYPFFWEVCTHVV